MATEREIYDFTQGIFDKLEREGVEVTPAIAAVTRAVAGGLIDFTNSFLEPDTDGQ